jgi:inner membrane protein
MDSFTQIVLGASVGEAVLGKKVGYKAPLWGAIAGTIPDLDVLVARQFDALTELLIHRGFSHSIVFCLLLSPLFGWLVYKLYRKQQGTFKDWTWLFFLALITHPLLDIFTTWGTQFFWPHPERIALKSIFVIDPLYTVPFTIFLILAIRLPKESPKRRRLNLLGLRISTAYLFLSLFNQSIAYDKFQYEFKKQDVDVKRFEVRATPFNTIMWACNAETEDAYLIGYYSFLDSKNRAIEFFSFPKNHEQIADLTSNNSDLSRLLSITDGYYAVERLNNSQWAIHDLRFGQVSGFLNGKGEFVFSYLVSKKDDKGIKIDFKPREFKEGKELMSQWWTRIQGL